MKGGQVVEGDKRDSISARQLYGMLFTGLLTPAVRVLPGLTAAVAGKGAWLTGLLAFPPLLGIGWMVFTLSRGEGGLCPGFASPEEKARTPSFCAKRKPPPARRSGRAGGGGFPDCGRRPLRAAP